MTADVPHPGSWRPAVIPPRNQRPCVVPPRPTVPAPPSGRRGCSPESPRTFDGGQRSEPVHLCPSPRRNPAPVDAALLSHAPHEPANGRHEFPRPLRSAVALHRLPDPPVHVVLE